MEAEVDLCFVVSAALGSRHCLPAARCVAAGGQNCTPNLRTGSTTTTTTGRSRRALVAGMDGVVQAISAPTIEKKGVKFREKTALKEPKKPQQYNVFVLNDPFNTREYVIKVLLQVIPNMSFSRAYTVMDTAHRTGKGLVITAVMEMAEAYASSILSAGIFSTVEPAD